MGQHVSSCAVINVAFAVCKHELDNCNNTTCWVTGWLHFLTAFRWANSLSKT